MSLTLLLKPSGAAAASAGLSGVLPTLMGGSGNTAATVGLSGVMPAYIGGSGTAPATKAPMRIRRRRVNFASLMNF